ncbi:hypothetical protein RAY_62 [Erwinia phage vB_EamM_RAY]|uniref:Transmembrane protein n=1 Tax=Erwinia phage vB_EamM_RAY TaxID=1815987 RepID=A0A173GE49_9CAUD|nr:hypothetical protein FDH98_gp062 [Erwinia phage vB_EamM_RAY]ANH51843.1 hypothetical protein RAY_62 [Erwinia phage vB_EamM_RAY]
MYMTDLWLYIAIFLLCYIWAFFGLPPTGNKRKLYLYPGIVAVAFCLGVMAIKNCSDSTTQYQPLYNVHQ